MGFLNPWLLMGTAGVAVPILIHLLNRFRHREVDWAAMELLRRAVVMRSRRIRLEDLIILLLRCLAVGLLALAMARPTITGSAARWFGGQQQVGAVLAVDVSYSMAYKPGVTGRFDHARKTLDQVRGTLRPGSPVSLVLMGNRPRTLLRSAGYDPRRFEKELEAVRPLPERLHLDRCLEVVASLLAETKAPVRECYLLTDAQALSWREPPPRARRALTELARDGQLFVVPTPADSAENLAVERFALESGSLRTGGLARYVARVRNRGARARENVPVRLFLGDEDVPVDRRVIERIEPGATVSVPLFARFRAAGDVKVAADLGRDALLADNARYAVAPVREQVRVLCVDGSPHPQKLPYRNATDYLVAALTSVPGPAGETLRAESVPHTRLAGTALANYDVVVLANVADVRDAEVDRLHRFVRDGGGLMIFLGDNTVPRLINARLGRKARPLLPAEVGRAMAAPRADAPGWPIEPAAVNHPMARFLHRVPAPLLAEARVDRAFELGLLPGAHEVLRLAAADRPLLVEKPLGRGRVLLFASTANRDWTNFLVHPVGPMLLHEAVTHLVASGRETAFRVGEPLLCELPEAGVGTRVRFRSPAGRDLPVQVTRSAGRTVAEVRGAAEAGFFELHHAEGEPPIVLAANVDPAESDVQTLGEEALRTALAGTNARLLRADGDLPATIRRSRIGIELSLPLLILGLLVLLAEALLAYRFSKTLSAVEGPNGLPQGRSP